MTDSPRTYLEPARQIPVLGNYDVVVCGGGPAGIGAALSAARAGANTALIERYGSLGGLWTTGLVNPLFDYANKGGIIREIIDHLKDRGAWQDDPRDRGGRDTFDYEHMKLLLDELILHEDIDLFLHTWVADSIVDSETVRGVIVESKSGRAALHAKTVIDCTGDGDLAARAGAPFEKGRPQDGLLQPLTLMFRLANCNYLQGDSGEVYSLMRQAAERMDVQLPPFQRPAIIALPTSGDAIVQAVHIYRIDATDVRQLTEACIAARKEAHLLARVFRNIPQLSDTRLVATAEQIGVRETRRIQGEYVVSIDDLVHGRRHPDGICLVSFGIDIHPIRPEDRDHAKAPKVEPYHIPYRSLVPLQTDGLLTAGRSVSGTHEAHASYRVTGDCMAMGEAAGLAAAWCARESITPREVDGTALRDELKARGTILD